MIVAAVPGGKSGTAIKAKSTPQPAAGKMLKITLLPRSDLIMIKIVKITGIPSKMSFAVPASIWSDGIKVVMSDTASLAIYWTSTSPRQILKNTMAALTRKSVNKITGTPMIPMRIAGPIC
jgi:hypothetical protein